MPNSLNPSLARPSRWPALLAAGAVVLTLAIAGARPGAAEVAPQSFADLADDLLPTVVNIATTQKIEDGEQSESFEDFLREFFERRGQPMPEQPRRGQTSLGSGFIIDSDGYIVTNNHVIAEADEIEVRLHDDRTYAAEIVGRDPETDLALLKIETEDSLPAADWGDSDDLRIGDWVIAIGNPFGLGGTVTAGIVSARARDINAGPYDDFIQSDAAINRGNSGGPMIDTDGKVIGVNTAIFSPSGGSIGIGFAIPSALAQNVIAQLKSSGEVKRGWLGVRVQTVTEELAEGLGLDEAQGALVARTDSGGPAASAGIEQGDVILEFDGQEVTDTRRLVRIVADTPVGETVPVVVWRKKEGGEKVLEVTLGERPADPTMAFSDPQSGGPDANEATIDSLGLTLATLTPELRTQFSLSEDIEGVVVTGAEADGPAAEKGIRPGHVITEVDAEKVVSPGEVAKHVSQAEADGYRLVTLLVYSQGEFTYKAVRIQS